MARVPRGHARSSLVRSVLTYVSGPASDTLSKRGDFGFGGTMKRRETLRGIGTLRCTAVLLALFAAVPLGAGACFTSITVVTGCTPGQSSACTGAASCTGFHVCKSDGSGFGDCLCGSGPSDSGGPNEGGPTADATRDAPGDSSERDAPKDSTEESPIPCPDGAAGTRQRMRQTARRRTPPQRTARTPQRRTYPQRTRSRTGQRRTHPKQGRRA
jgi:hypothetical protein